MPDFWRESEPKPRSLRHVRLLSGWWNGLKSLVGIGAAEIGQEPYDATTNPTGWQEDQVATCGWTEVRMEPLAREMRETNERLTETNRLLTNLLLGLRASGMATETLGDLPPGLHSVGGV